MAETITVKAAIAKNGRAVLPIDRTFSADEVYVNEPIELANGDTRTWTLTDAGIGIATVHGFGLKADGLLKVYPFGLVGYPYFQARECLIETEGTADIVPGAGLDTLSIKNDSGSTVKATVLFWGT